MTRIKFNEDTTDNIASFHRCQKWQLTKQEAPFKIKYKYYDVDKGLIEGGIGCDESNELFECVISNIKPIESGSSRFENLLAIKHSCNCAYGAENDGKCSHTFRLYLEYIQPFWKKYVKCLNSTRGLRNS